MDPSTPHTTALHCPACGYDVATLIHRGEETCPECGGHIDERNCHPPLWSDAFKRDARRYLARCAIGGGVAGLGVGLLGFTAMMVISTFVVAMPGVFMAARGAENVWQRACARTADPRTARVFPVLGALGFIACAGAYAIGVVIVLRGAGWA